MHCLAVGEGKEMRIVALMTVLGVICWPVWATVALEEGVLLEARPLAVEANPVALMVKGIVQALDGQTLDGVSVWWWERERPEGLQRDTSPAAVTDTDGNFSIELPRPDVWYTVSIERYGYLPKEVYVFGEETTLQVALARAEVFAPISGTVTADGQPAKATVFMLADRGRSVISVETNEDGAFQFTGVPKDYREPSMYARSGERYSRVSSMPNPKGSWELSLDAHGRLGGTVLSAETQAPVPGCQVGFVPFGVDVPLQTTDTDARGNFFSPALPPGTYSVSVQHPVFAEPENGGLQPQRVPIDVVPGGAATYQAFVFPRTSISGQVLTASGNPAAGAWVGAEARVSHGGNGQWPDGRRVTQIIEPVRTDGNGHYVIHAPFSDRTVWLEAYHPIAGKTRKEVHVPAAGAKSEGILMHLSGVIRVQGTVRGQKNEPIADVLLGELSTDQDGQFDSGLAAFPALTKGSLLLDFIAPRLSPAAIHESDRMTRYLHRTVSFAPAPGQAITLDVALKPTRTITVYGVVRDHEGLPVAGAEIAVHPGEGAKIPNINRQGTYTPWRPKARPAGSLLQSLRRQGMGPRSAPTASTVSDAHGAWKLAFAVESPGSLRAVYSGTGLPLVGVRLQAKHVARSLEAYVQLDDLALLEDTFEIELVLRSGTEASPSGTFFRAQVVDTAGNPLPGIQWLWGKPSEPKTTTTDGDGNLLFPLDSRTHLFSLASDSWSIVSPPSYGDSKSLRAKWDGKEQPLRIVLGPRGTFTFQAFYPDGTPAPVRALLGPLQHDVRQIYTPDGFILENFPSGRHVLDLDAPEGFFREIRVELPSNGKGTQTLEIPKPTCAINGVVKDTQGEPQGQIELMLEGMDYRKVNTSESDGTFEFRAPPGVYTLGATRETIPCLATQYNEVLVAPEDTNQLTLALTVTKSSIPVVNSNLALPGRFLVKVVSGEGTPLAGLKLSVRKQNSSDYRMTGITDQTGFATFENVSPGLYWLTLEQGSPGGAKRQYAIPVEPGSDRRHTLNVRAGVTVSGIIQGAIEDMNLSVLLTSLADGVQLIAKPGPDGRFHFSDVPIGPATVLYRMGGGATEIVTRISVDAQMGPLSFEPAIAVP